MAGFYDLLKQSNVTPYESGKLTSKDIEEAIGKLFENHRPQPTIIYTDYTGHQLMQFSANINQLLNGVKWWCYVPKRVRNRFIYVSLFKKHGFLKLKIYLDGRRLKYELFNATTSIGVSDKIECIQVLKRLNERLS